MHQNQIARPPTRRVDKTIDSLPFMVNPTSARIIVGKVSKVGIASSQCFPENKGVLRKNFVKITLYYYICPLFCFFRSLQPIIHEIRFVGRIFRIPAYKTLSEL